MALKGSVGQNGVNQRHDVRRVQQLLNGSLHLLIPLRPVSEDGRCGDLTIAAIKEFQRRVLGLSQPDGRVDPQGSTWRKLVATGLNLIQLPATGTCYDAYTTSDKTFGTAATIASVQSGAQKVFLAVGTPAAVEIGIGDISLRSGGAMPPHASHQEGRDVDIRPLRSDGKRLPVTFQDPNYSRERTRKLVECLRQDTNLESILFNDSSIAGVKNWQGHDNHLHVRFRK